MNRQRFESLQLTIGQQPGLLGESIQGLGGVASRDRARVGTAKVLPLRLLYCFPACERGSLALLDAAEAPTQRKGDVILRVPSRWRHAPA